MSMKAKPKPRSAAFWPIIGLMVLLSAGAIAYFAGPAVVDWMDESNVVRGFPPSGVPESTVDWILRFIVFVVVFLLVSLAVAAAVPKKKTMVNEKQLSKQRQEMVNSKKAMKIRQRAMNKQNRRDL